MVETSEARVRSGRSAATLCFGNRTTYTHDAADQLTGRLYPNGSRTTFCYDPAGNRTIMADGTCRTTSTYDPVNRRSTVTNPASLTITYQYDGVGRKCGMTAPGGGVFT